MQLKIAKALDQKGIGTIYWDYALKQTKNTTAFASSQKYCCKFSFDLALLVMALQIPVYEIISERFSRKTYFYKLFRQIEALPELKQLSLI